MKKCYWCGLHYWKLHKHHIIPVKEGGRNIEKNYLFLCASCHSKVHHGKIKLPKEIIIKANEEQTKEDIHSWTCPTCKKEIHSMYEKQLEQNKKSHLSTHGEEDEL